LHFGDIPKENTFHRRNGGAELSHSALSVLRLKGQRITSLLQYVWKLEKFITFTINIFFSVHSSSYVDSRYSTLARKSLTDSTTPCTPVFFITSFPWALTATPCSSILSTGIAAFSCVVCWMQMRLRSDNSNHAVELNVVNVFPAFVANHNFLNCVFAKPLKAKVKFWGIKGVLTLLPWQVKEFTCEGTFSDAANLFVKIFVSFIYDCGTSASSILKVLFNQS